MRQDREQVRGGKALAKPRETLPAELSLNRAAVPVDSCPKGVVNTVCKAQCPGFPSVSAWGFIRHLLRGASLF